MTVEKPQLGRGAGVGQGFADMWASNCLEEDFYVMLNLNRRFLINDELGLILMLNPHYQRLTMTYRKYFQPMKLPIGWLIWLMATVLLYWQGSYQLFWLLPFMLFGLIIILGIETARFVTTDRHQPIYDMTLLTPLSAHEIVTGYRQAAFARTARWLGLGSKLFVGLVLASYCVLSYKMWILVEADIRREFQPTGLSDFWGESFVHDLIIIVFTIWVSLLFSSLTYYVLAIEVNIALGLRFESWSAAFIAGLITSILVFVSSVFVVGIAAYLGGIFAYWHDSIPIAFTLLAFCGYPLYWRNVFRDRAVNNIRSDEKVNSWDSGYVDLA